MLVKSTIVETLVVLFCSIIVSTWTVAAEAEILANVHTWQWPHGREDCKTTQDPAIEVLKVTANSFILRQDKCSHFEAPFMYLLIGDHKALLFDTGATSDANEFPIYKATIKLIEELSSASQVIIEELIVLHSHRHRDHYAGDEQFLGHSNTTVVAADRQALASKFDMPISSTRQADFDLGRRKIALIPIPGHQADSIALFDQQTGWLLTGDTLYPGLIKVRDWNAFKSSIARLTAFTQSHAVSAILGGHIEMRSDRSEIYPIGSTFQPKELPLAIATAELVELNTKLRKMAKPQTVKFEKFIISPLNFLERQLQKILSKTTKGLGISQHEKLAHAHLNFSCVHNHQRLGYNSRANKRSNTFVGHQFQQQSVINTPVDYV